MYHDQREEAFIGEWCLPCSVRWRRACHRWSWWCTRWCPPWWGTSPPQLVCLRSLRQASFQWAQLRGTSGSWSRGRRGINLWWQGWNSKPTSPAGSGGMGPNTGDSGTGTWFRPALVKPCWLFSRPLFLQCPFSGRGWCSPTTPPPARGTAPPRRIPWRYKHGNGCIQVTQLGSSIVIAQTIQNQISHIVALHVYAFTFILQKRDGNLKQMSISDCLNMYVSMTR